MQTKRTMLSEASLSRMFQHIENGKSWGLISAGRHEQTPQERSRATHSLASDIRSLGYGFIPVEGRWTEKNTETGEKVEVIEPSFFVPEITRKELMKLASKYNQEAVVYGEPDPDIRMEPKHDAHGEPKILLIEPPNRVLEVIGSNDRRSFNPNKVSTVYTKIKGKTFTLGEAVAVPLNKTAAELRVGTQDDNDLQKMIMKFVKNKGRSS